jgi:hypothetical protein
MMKLFSATVFLFFLCSNTSAQQVYVKYRGMVDVGNGHLQSYNLKPSSLVQKIYYDPPNNYLIVSLNGTYYHYCGIPKNIVDRWISADSLGRFYGSYVKGNYDCRVYPVPEY